MKTIIFLIAIALIGLIFERFSNKWIANASEDEKKKIKASIKRSEKVTKKILIGIVLVFILLILVNNSDLFK